MKLPETLRALWFGQVASRLLAFRQKGVNGLMSLLYGHPVQIMPKGTMGVAGAIVLWYLQDGFKQFVLIKNDSGDPRARFVSCLGVGKHPDMGAALRAVLEWQFGEVFTRTLGDKSLDVDRVAAVPVFSYLDEATGVLTPVQALVWCVQIQPAQVDLLVTAKGFTAVIVPEFGMSSAKVSPTHRSLWLAAHRHVPASKNKPTTGNMSQIDETVKDVEAIPPTRVLN